MGFFIQWAFKTKNKERTLYKGKYNSTRNYGASLLGSQKTSSEDLSNIPGLPENPISIIKDAIKLRFNWSK